MSTQSRGPPETRWPGTQVPLVLQSHLLACFMRICAVIYCSLPLESFFIVVMLTYENTASTNAGVYYIREPQL